MSNIFDIIRRAESLRDEKALNSISPERVGGIMTDTLKYLNDFQLSSGSLGLDKTYTSISAMNADTEPVSDITGKPLKAGQLAVIVPTVESDPDAGKVYRYNSPGDWTYIQTIGNIIADKELSETSENPIQNSTVTRLVTEYNVSNHFPTGGIDGTNRYTLETAIAKIPASLRTVGIKCSFINEGGKPETWEWQGGTFTDTNSWEQIGANSPRIDSLQASVKSISTFSFCIDVPQRGKTSYDVYIPKGMYYIYLEGDLNASLAYGLTLIDNLGQNKLYTIYSGSKYPITLDNDVISVVTNISEEVSLDYKLHIELLGETLKAATVRMNRQLYGTIDFSPVYDKNFVVLQNLKLYSNDNYRATDYIPIANYKYVKFSGYFGNDTTPLMAVYDRDFKPIWSSCFFSSENVIDHVVDLTSIKEAGGEYVTMHSSRNLAHNALFYNESGISKDVGRLQEDVCRLQEDVGRLNESIVVAGIVDVPLTKSENLMLADGAVGRNNTSDLYYCVVRSGDNLEIDAKLTGNYIRFAFSSDVPVNGTPVTNYESHNHGTVHEQKYTLNAPYDGYLVITLIRDTFVMLAVTRTKDDIGADVYRVTELANDNKRRLDELSPEPSADFTKDDTQITNSIKLNLPDNRKVILHIHKRDKDGYGAANDIFLPLINYDFSDLAITDNNGNEIPFQIMSRVNGIDILPDYRLGMDVTGTPFEDSEHNIYVCESGLIRKSSDFGKTWEVIESLRPICDRSVIVTLITEDDTLYFSKDGVLYRSEKPYATYEQVLDTRESYTGCFILSTSMVDCGGGVLICGAYQLQYAARIYRSNDNGHTWTKVFSSIGTQDQHIHHVYIDRNTSPYTLYAGIDVSNDVLKSTDLGLNWTRLRGDTGTTVIPFSTDYGVIYADKNGYKLLGGETAIHGGSSIIKTKDESNYYSVMDSGNACYTVEKINGVLVAPLISSSCIRNSPIAVSMDDGETWKNLYNTINLPDRAASDGYRFLTKLSNGELLLCPQSKTQPPLRVVKEGAYAEIIVDIPEGTSEIAIGGAYKGQTYNINVNDSEDAADPLISEAFNSPTEQDGYIKGGKHLGNIYPYIITEADKYAKRLKDISPISFTADMASIDAITISFWARLDPGYSFRLIADPDGYGFNLQLWIYTRVGGKALGARIDWSTKTWDKYDIIIDFQNNTMTGYCNAIAITDNGDEDISEELNHLKGQTQFECLRSNRIAPDECAIQHFSIISRAKSITEIINEYESGLTDLIND